MIELHYMLDRIIEVYLLNSKAMTNNVLEIQFKNTKNWYIFLKFIRHVSFIIISNMCKFQVVCIITKLH